MLRVLLLAFALLPVSAQAQRSIEGLSGTDLGSGRIVDSLRVSPPQLNSLDVESLTITHRRGEDPVIVASDRYVLVATVADGETLADCTAPRVRCVIVEAGPSGRVLRVDD